MKKRLKHIHPGWFITFEGPEGAGKSTQIRLLRDELEARGHACVLTREPGGTPLAERLRAVVKNYEGPEKLHPTTELLLIEAARSQHVRGRWCSATASSTRPPPIRAARAAWSRR